MFILWKAWQGLIVSLVEHFPWN